ncbi:MAG TPA: hypothetical protein VN829_25120, partial [Dongiaceae bacterium]|nr:hypothetical protein [Dongiaceae bacterium]
TRRQQVIASSFARIMPGFCAAMKTRVLAAGHIALFILTALAAKAAEPATFFTPLRDSRVWLEGNATVNPTPMSSVTASPS